jgi:hypothetical protein
LNQRLDITALITLYCAQTTHKFSRGAKEKFPLPLIPSPRNAGEGKDI